MANPKKGTDREKWKREIRKGSIQLVILSVLAEERRYGFQIVKELRERSQGYFDIKEGTLYPALHGLEKGGFVTSEWYSPDDTPPKKFYTLTGEGTAYLKKIKAEWLILQDRVKTIIFEEKEGEK